MFFVFRSVVSYQEIFHNEFNVVATTHHQLANRLHFLSAAPPKYIPYTPKIHRTVSPASRLTPPSVPSRANIGPANRTAPAAKVLCTNPFAANSDPE
jgi:hypothetical protein